ncbi:MAG: hypothetical protein EBZ74_04845 [Planctomycetia bacterium]|nr:hypothetical protein [Planctomycetia bacterium]
MPTRPARDAALGLIALALLGACSGCSTLLTAAYVLMPEDTPAEFGGLKGKHVAVVCRPIVELEFSDAGSGRELATAVGGFLQRNVRRARIIDQHEVARWIDEHAWVDYPTVGKALDADLVVAIDLEQFRLHEGATLYRGRAAAHVRVFDIAAGKVVFDKRLDDFQYPAEGAIPTADRSEPQFRGMFLQILAARIARSFHSYDSRTSFAEENLTF